jgi:alpha-L-fucosidase
LLSISQNSSIKASHTRGKAFSAKNATDDDPETSWAPENDVLEASIEIDFGRPVEVNAILLQEFIPLGQRVRSFSVAAYIDETFNQLATGVTVGNRRIVKFETVKTHRLKIYLEAKAYPLIANIKVYRVPDI